MKNKLKLCFRIFLDFVLTMEARKRGLIGHNEMVICHTRGDFYENVTKEKFKRKSHLKLVQ